MSKLVLQLLIVDRKDKIYRNTGIRIFDRKSLNAAISAVRAKSFGLLSKGKFVVQFDKPDWLSGDVKYIPRFDQDHDRLWRLSNETGLLPLFVRLGETPVSSGPMTEHRKGAQYFVHGEISHLFNETH